MRAACMTDVNWVEVRDTEEPKLDPRGAILRVEACGICGTDARTFFNGDPRAPAPWVLGHEPVGVVERVRPEGVLPPGAEAGGPGVRAPPPPWAARAARGGGPGGAGPTASRPPGAGPAGRFSWARSSPVASAASASTA